MFHNIINQPPPPPKGGYEVTFDSYLKPLQVFEQLIKSPLGDLGAAL